MAHLSNHHGQQRQAAWKTCGEWIKNKHPFQTNHERFFLERERMMKNLFQPKAKRQKVNFEIWAPAAHTVSLMGTFNQWNSKTHPMKKSSDGCWRKSILVVPGRHEYRYLVDGKWENDPANSNCCPSEYGTSNIVIEVLPG